MMKLASFRPQIDATKKDEILAAATKVFSDVGFKEATIRQICKQARANVCLVSYYFEGKEGLYRAIFERVALARKKRAEDFFGNKDKIETKEEFKETILNFCKVFYTEVSSKPEFFRMVNREIQDGMPRAADIIRIFHEEIMSLFVDFIAFGQKKKFARRDLDARLVAGSMINMFMGFINQQSLNKPELFFPGINPKEIPEKIIKTVFTLFCEGTLA